MARSPCYSASVPAFSADGSEQGISCRLCLTWLLMVLQFRSAAAWVLLRILGTFKSRVGSLLCDSVGPIARLSASKAAEGLGAISQPLCPSPSLCSEPWLVHLSFTGLQAESHLHCP